MWINVKNRSLLAAIFNIASKSNDLNIGGRACLSTAIDSLCNVKVHDVGVRVCVFNAMYYII